MDSIVGVVRGRDKFQSFDELLALTEFDERLEAAWRTTHKPKEEFRVVIKPNLMVFVNQPNWQAVVTDPELVERLVDHILSLGYPHVAVCEARTDVSAMLQNQNVAFIAKQVGYRPNGRYRIADLSLESTRYSYEYLDGRGRPRKWRDVVGKTWKEADFRVTFAKAKTHEHDWLTLSIKNVYGCFPSPFKIRKYHMHDEVFDVTARSLRNFPVHFAFVDAWVASDGFQGYKIANPRPLNMLFGGASCVSVDVEIFKRAGFATCPSKMVLRAVEQLHGGKLPAYTVKGDLATTFAALGPWDNISDQTVQFVDRAEEVFINWGFINMKASSYVDYVMFPPRTLVYRLGVWAMKWVYKLLAALRIWGRIFHS